MGYNIGGAVNTVDMQERINAKHYIKLRRRLGLEHKNNYGMETWY